MAKLISHLCGKGFLGHFFIQNALTLVYFSRPLYYLFLHGTGRISCCRILHSWIACARIGGRCIGGGRMNWRSQFWWSLIIHPPFRILNSSDLDPINDNTVRTSMYFHLLTNESDFLTLSSRKWGQEKNLMKSLSKWKTTCCLFLFLAQLHLALPHMDCTARLCLFLLKLQPH